MLPITTRHCLNNYRKGESMNKNRSIGMVFLLLLIFFAISLLTNIFNTVLPQSKDSYSLTHGVSGLLLLAFFLACGFTLIPSEVIKND